VTVYFASNGERMCAENYKKWHNKFIFKLQSAFCKFQTITVSEWCLKKLLPHILFEKYIYILALEKASPENRHCADCIGTLSFRIFLGAAPHCTELLRYIHIRTVASPSVNTLKQLQDGAWFSCQPSRWEATGTESVPKIIINDTKFIFKLQSAFW